jgi:hypothetical protein
MFLIKKMSKLSTHLLHIGRKLNNWQLHPYIPRNGKEFYEQKVMYLRILKRKKPVMKNKEKKRVF